MGDTVIALCNATMGKKASETIVGSLSLKRERKARNTQICIGKVEISYELRLLNRKKQKLAIG